MSSPFDWKEFWEQKARVNLSDFEVDRLSRCQDQEIEKLAEQELIDFISPGDSETVLDAGCGTGVNILRLHSRVKAIIGIDYSLGSLERCQKRIREQDVKNASTVEASVTAIPLPSRSVDKVLCLSVLHYLNDREVRQALAEFVRVVRPGGVIVFHVKNRSSLYWATLRPAKKVKAFLKKVALVEHIRGFQWYVNELARLGCIVLDYDSFNLLTVDVMPGKLVSSVRKFEISKHRSSFFRSSLVRRHGAELMIKAIAPGIVG